MRAQSYRFANLAVAALMLVCAFPLAVRAGEKPDTAEFDIVPYVWGAGIEGTVGIGTLANQGVEADFSDILGDIDVAAMGTFAARKGDWGAILEAISTDTSDTVPTTNPAVYGAADVALEGRFYSGLVTYRIVDARKTTIDLGWGGRYHRIDTDIELVSGAAQGRYASSTVDFWDWLAGMRVVGQPSPRWSWLVSAAIGGGGSKLSWEGSAGADFAFNKTVSLAFGYRHLAIDYQENGLLYNVSMAGPYLGLGFHF